MCRILLVSAWGYRARHLDEDARAVWVSISIRASATSRAHHASHANHAHQTVHSNRSGRWDGAGRRRWGSVQRGRLSARLTGFRSSKAGGLNLMSSDGRP